MLLFGVLSLAGCTGPTATHAPSAHENGTLSPASASGAPASASTPPAPAPATPANGSAPATQARHEHAAGSWTATANGVGFVGAIPPEFTLPQGAVAGTLFLNWSAQGPGPLSLGVHSKAASIWKKPLASSPAVFPLSVSDLDTLRDAAFVDVTAEGGAAAQVAYTLDAEFLVTS